VLKVMHFAQELRPNLAIIVRTQDDSELERLMQAGASEVVPEIFEGSLMLGSHALVLLGVPLGRVVRRVREARDQRYRLLRGYFHGASDDENAVEEEARARLHSVALDPGAAAVGKRIDQLELAVVGADVTAVRRRGIRGAEPSPDMVLQAGDVLVLRGPAEALELAEEQLLQR
jgi:CPA2 family monovalent cation:H+ antiporter-2